MPHEHLRLEQDRTLSSPRLDYGFLAQALFIGLDLFYGRRRTLSKFKVLEVIARVPYQAWEHVAYIAMTHKYGEPNFARRIFDFVSEARQQQDNEQWHLLILEELVERRDIREGFVRYRLLPQVIAFFYYHVSWLLYVVRPRLSYELNAHFEDHAEHEYMEFVRENPELEATPFRSVFEKDYGVFRNQADLFRQIGLDERHHKEESLARMVQPRFTAPRRAAG
jgi:ubiquinol oxidase